MKALILGAGGQLGRALQAMVPASVQITAPSEDVCDITQAAQVEDWIKRVRPDIVFNAAAYTAVDAAEKDEEAAFRANAEAPGIAAGLAAQHGARVVHVSTDFVFDGESSEPYAPGDAPRPLSVYGRSKLAGEEAVAKVLPNALIVRTAWVYAEQGRNFVHTMLRLMRERGAVKVVADQIGTPTYARNLAQALWTLADRSASGVYHFTDSGVASWYDFAVAIAEEANGAGLLDRDVLVTPIATSEYPTPALRPRFSVLDKSKTWAVLGHTGQHWRVALREMLKRLKANG